MIFTTEKYYKIALSFHATIDSRLKTMVMKFSDSDCTKLNHDRQITYKGFTIPALMLTEQEVSDDAASDYLKDFNKLLNEISEGSSYTDDLRYAIEALNDKMEYSNIENKIEGHVIQEILLGDEYNDYDSSNC